MRILMIASFLPYPLYSGGQIRLYNLLKQLKNTHEITLICEKRESETEEDIKEVEKICRKVITVKRRKQWTIQNIFNSVLSPHSFLTTGHNNPEMRQKIKEELANNNFDLIHVETYYVFQNIPETALPIVLVEHNIEYQVYSRFVQKTPLPLRPFLTIDVAKIKNEEINFWKKVQVLAAVSHEDQKVMQSEGQNAQIVPNGVDTENFSFKSHKARQKERKILFIGDFKWIQNRDSITWIIKDIWPGIKAGNGQGLNIQLWIVGRNIPESVKSLSGDPEIIFDEETSTKPTREIFQEADLLLAPIRVGGGTSYKILESMSTGTPVIITPLSAQSLGVKDSQEALVGETAQEIAAKTLIVLNDPHLYQKIAKNGRELVEKNYTWEKISKKLNAVYEAAAGKRHSKK